jgi:hypothetical protein
MSRAFSLMGITNLHPIQLLCLNYCIQAPTNEPKFIRFDVGYGKTSLCLALAVESVNKGNKVFVINASKDLTFRDFKKAGVVLKIQLKVCHIDNDDFSQADGANIIYITL